MLMKTIPVYITLVILMGSVNVPAAADGTISTQDGLSLTLTADGRVSAVVVEGDNLVVQPSPAIRIRDLSLAGTTFTPNLVTNADFELDADNNNLPDGWTQFSSSNAPSVGLSSQHSEGNVSIVFDVDGGNAGTVALTSDPISVTPGITYRLSAVMQAYGGYLAEQHTNLDWQRDFYLGDALASGLFIEWFDDQGAPVLVGSAPQQAVAPLHADANAWKRITGEVIAPAQAHTARFVVGAKLRRRPATGGDAEKLWVDDVSMIVAPEIDIAVPGSVETTSSMLTFKGNLAAENLHVQATWHAFADHLQIDGQVNELTVTGTDRALEIAIRFPANLNGYAWWDDIDTKRVVAANQTYGNIISATVTGMLPQSLYPLAALTDNAHGLAVALPMDTPQVAALRYIDGALEARFALGISAAALRLDGSAQFHLSLFTFAPTWGLRAALSRFAEMNPMWFNTPRDLSVFSNFHRGNFANLNCQPDDSDCALSDVANDDQNGDATAEYTLPEGLMQIALATDPPPAYTNIEQKLLGNPAGSRLAAIETSSTRSGNGDRTLKSVRIPGNSPKLWVATWVLNMDPEITDGYARWIRDNRVDPAFADTDSAGLHLDGVFVDNFMSAPVVDLDPSHLALADSTLSFDPATYRPGVHTQAGVFKFLVWLRQDLDTTRFMNNQPGTDRGIITNTWGIGTVNALVPFADGLFNEGSPTKGVNWSDNILRYRRTMAYHKKMAFTDQDEFDSKYQDAATFTKNVHAFAQQAVFYGIAPSGGPKVDNWPQTALDEIAQARNLLVYYDSLGWEPVTHASLDNPALRVERFGANTSQPITFTVYNAGGDTSYTLTIDTDTLGLPDSANLSVQDALTGQTLPHTDNGAGQILVNNTIQEATTEVIQVIATAPPPPLTDGGGGGGGGCTINTRLDFDPLWIFFVLLTWRLAQSKRLVT